MRSSRRTGFRNTAWWVQDPLEKRLTRWFQDPPKKRLMEKLEDLDVLIEEMAGADLAMQAVHEEFLRFRDATDKFFIFDALRGNNNNNKKNDKTPRVRTRKRTSPPI